MMDGKLRQPRLLFLTIGMFIVLVVSAFGPPPNPSLSSNAAGPPGPDRYSSIMVDYTRYTWWMMQWENNSLVCEMETDHEGPPTLGEVYVDCGQTIYNKWVNQDPCYEYHKKNCDGYYVFLFDAVPSQREITVELPPAEAFVSLEECTPVSTTATNLCEELPVLVLTGHEPLPNEHILGIGGTIDGTQFSCDNPCRIQLVATDEDGVTVQFWAYSSYGDSSEIYTAQVRVIASTEGNPDQSYWYVDVLSSQWIGQPAASCAESWEAFPPVGGPPEWLTTPNRPEDLITEVPYEYLAANLIRSGAVDASICENGGLLEDSYGANTCGLEIAQPAVTEWQNRFDDLIMQVSQETGVPAQMLKKLFARESQFWPAVFMEGSDIGLGQLTENGADTTLLWNPSFFEQFCPLVLESKRCAKGYLHLDEEEQNILRLGLISTVNATCFECPLGIDLTRADFSVRVFGHTMLANCEQTGRIVRNVTGQAPGKVATYEDLWKFTLVNYNGGPGCLYTALRTAKDDGNPLEWDYVSQDLIGVCSLSADYVNDISQ